MDGPSEEGRGETPRNRWASRETKVQRKTCRENSTDRGECEGSTEEGPQEQGRQKHKGTALVRRGKGRIRNKENNA